MTESLRFFSFQLQPLPRMNTEISVTSQTLYVVFQLLRGSTTFKLFAFFRLVFHALKFRYKTPSASRRACSELNVALGIILEEFSRNRIDVLPYFSSSMHWIEGVC